MGGDLGERRCHRTAHRPGRLGVDCVISEEAVVLAKEEEGQRIVDAGQPGEGDREEGEAWTGESGKAKARARQAIWKAYNSRGGGQLKEIQLIRHVQLNLPSVRAAKLFPSAHHSQEERGGG